MNSLLYILPLKTWVADQWILNVFGGIRTTMLDQTSKVVPLALMIAGIIVVFKLAKMSYTIMTDEKDSGFGGITLWELLRPVLILVLTGSCSVAIGMLDTATDAVSVAISRTVDHSGIQASRESLLESLSKNETDYYKAADSLKRVLEEEAQKKQSELDKKAREQDAIEWHYDGLGKYYTISVDNNPELKAVKDEIIGIRRNSVMLQEAIKDTQRSTARLTKQYAKALDNGDDIPKDATPRTFFTSICFWLSDKLAYCMMAFADIILCCMAIVAPLTFALSLVDKWKDAIWNFCAKYFEVSMWKVTANVILSVTANAYSAAMLVVNTSAQSLISSVGTAHTVNTSYATCAQAQMISTVICLASIFATLSIPGITSTILSLGGGPASGGDGAKGGAVAIMKAPGKTVSGGFSAGMNIGKLNAIKTH